MLLDDMADLLSTGGIVTTMYRGFMPEQPDECIQLLETGGFPSVHGMSGSAGAAVEEQPTFQVLRRSPSYARARIEMNVIFKLLDGAGDITINGTRYKWIAALQSAPLPLGRDASNRELLSQNYVAAKELSTSTST